MSENTITIPADLWEPSFSTAEMFDGLDESLRSCECGHPVMRTLLRNLRREIERQAPRPEGWYSIRYDDSGGHRTFLYWEASIGKWRESNGVLRDDYLRHDGAIIEPVTIGDVLHGRDVERS